MVKIIDTHFDKIADISTILISANQNKYFNELTNKLGFPINTIEDLLKNKEDSFLYSFLVVLAFMLKRDEDRMGKEHAVIMENVLTLLLESFSVSDVENGNCKISLKYNDIKMVVKRIKM
mgnify:CR=1 FL=1